MALVSPRRPVQLVLLGAVGWLLFTAAAAYFDEEGFWGRVAVDGFRAFAAVFAALVLGGGLLELWQRKEWQNRTQWIVVDLLDRTMWRLGGVAAALRALPPPVDAADAIAPTLSDVFLLPWSSTRSQVLAVEADSRTSAGLHWVLEQWSEQDEDEPVDESFGRLAAATDELWDVARDLSGYLDDRHGPKVLSEVSQLHHAVRQVVDPFLGDDVPGKAHAAVVTVGIRKIFESLAKVGEALDVAYGASRRHLSDDKLIAHLASLEARSKESDADLKQSLEEDSEFRDTLQRFESATNQVIETGEEIVRDLRMILEDPHLTAEDLQLVRDTLGEVGSALDTSLVAMRDDTGQSGLNPPGQ